MGGVGWMTPNFQPINSLYRFSLGTVLDFVDLSCLVVNVKFEVENVAAMFLEMWQRCEIMWRLCSKMWRLCYT